MSTVRKINVFLAVILLTMCSVEPGRDQIIRRVPPLARARYRTEVRSYPSELLSKFWKKKLSIKAAVILPETYQTEPSKYFPVVFHFPGFGGDETDGFDFADAIHALEAKRPELEMIHVFVRTSFFAAYHSFVDSECAGPWGAAFLNELLPALESRYRISTEPGKRFLTGHSSGGWTAVWLQVAYPERFGGVWASAPDPLDFRSFFGIDLSPGSTDNVYVDRAGKLRPYARGHKTTLRSTLRPVDGDDVDPEFDSDEWKWSPCGPDGKPRPFFNREDGVTDPAVLAAWERFDVRKIVENRWPQISRALRGKIHIICGEADTFFLEAPTKLFCTALANLGETTSCVFVPGRNHNNLYAPSPQFPEGLLTGILEQMGR